MIHLNRFNGGEFVLNCELIQSIESTPDTIVTLTTGEKIRVQEGVKEIVFATEEYHRRITQEPFREGSDGKRIET